MEAAKSIAYFDNKSDWNLNKTRGLFKDLLPRNDFADFEKAWEASKMAKTTKN